MATAGYLISRAAEQPAILSLTAAIVAVRFFGLARPLARYLERLASHDLALRALGRVRTRVYERIEPLAPAQLEGYAEGDLLSRMVADVDALQNLHLRGVGPPLVALAGRRALGRRRRRLPPGGGARARRRAARRRRRGAGARRPPRPAGAAQRQAAARGELSAELVELLGAAPELVAYGARGGRAGARSRGRPSARATRAAATRSPAASPTASGCSSPGVTVAGVLAARGRRARRGRARPRPDRDARAAGARVVRGGPAACRRGARAGRRRSPPGGASSS